MTDITRRKFNKIIGIAVAAPFTSLVANRVVYGAEMVDPDSAAAKGLQFMLESDKEDMHCAKCNFYSATEDGDKGECIIFSGATVPMTGWCSAYQPKK